jgi:hypothetical protein
MDSASIPAGRLYEDLAFLMPLVSPPEEYAEEASHWREILRDKLGDGKHKVLELGAGGGHNLSHLTADFELTATDISETMLGQCGRLNPGVELIPGDMRTLRLRRVFAAVLIHDAISYMLTEPDLLAAFKTAAAHLESGGILIASPDRFTETFRAPGIEHATHSDGSAEVSYLEYTYDPDTSDSEVETVMFYLIRTPDGLRIEHDRHVTGLFPRDTWIRLLDEAGFSSEIRLFHLGEDRRRYELLVGVRR